MAVSSAASVYDIGDLVQFTGTFTKLEDDSLIDPTTVRFLFRRPSGTTDIYVYGTDSEIVRTSLGIYKMSLPIDEEGDWYYRIESTGTGRAAQEQRFSVRDSKFYPE
jgi:hypothetical protein